MSCGLDVNTVESQKQYDYIEIYANSSETVHFEYIKGGCGPILLVQDGR